MRTIGGTLSGSLATVLVAAAVIWLTEHVWLQVPAWIAIVIAVYVAARAIVEAVGRAARVLIRIIATGGFALLYPGLRPRSHRPPAGTWRNAIYTGGLGVLQKRERKDGEWTRK